MEKPRAVKPEWLRLMEIGKATRAGEGWQGAAGPSASDHDLTLHSLHRPASPRKFHPDISITPACCRLWVSASSMTISKTVQMPPCPPLSSWQMFWSDEATGTGISALILTQPCIAASTEHLHLRGWSHTPLLAAREMLLQAGESSAAGRQCPRWCLSPFLSL